MIRNPVLHKELLLRARFRQPKPARIGGGLAVVGLLGFCYYQAITYLWVDPTRAGARLAWSWVMGLQFALICLLTPALAANAIAQEKEQQTWEMLIFTRLRADEIVLGKLIARLALLAAAMALVFPIGLYCTVHTHGTGVGDDNYISFATFLMAEGTAFVVGAFFTTFSLCMSWLLNRTLYALIVSYTFVVGGLVLSTALITWMLSYILNEYTFLESCPLMWFNPVVIFLGSTGQNPSSQASLYLVFGLTGYSMLSVVMVCWMILGFRRHSQE